ncbi:hypothetical protein ASPWEDRAFT_46564 [Aspergillus wentii DTO 134E9]|uniref:DUF6924 domain-containing protein n=1 Tax=Aspergillus wentii DTO 134E9 TaxID=1073089 RepID=A0A1L9R4J0_ASPWE|nr:uncharacterized protein ASPWEDRAFT_46564 [Aspergillus wentii DTO 134E9]KAI9927081.1 hypothetical protein MW887_003464 [Aspergillus wentii]OJJ29802.1 hypothetical protein ASPWEDRAFT_46564 [Aspergillus wentii DTO 134E9]
MSESLIPLIITHEVHPQTLSSILINAYRKATEIKSPPTIILLTETSKEAIQAYNYDSITHPPIDSFKSPFLGWDLPKVAQFLTENAKKSRVDAWVFLIADEKTAEDGETLLLAQSDSNGLKSVRVTGEDVNTEAIAVSVATKDVGELITLVGEDGVYRSGYSKKKGGSAPRKQL